MRMPGTIAVQITHQILLHWHPSLVGHAKKLEPSKVHEDLTYFIS